MSTNFLISGYWKDTKENFEDYLVSDSHDFDDETDDNIFYYGLSEKLIQEAILSEHNTIYEFVITSYKKVNADPLTKYVSMKQPETIGEKLIVERVFNKELLKELSKKDSQIEELKLELDLTKSIIQDAINALTIDEHINLVSKKQKRRMALLRTQNETIQKLTDVVFRLRSQIKKHGS